MNDGSNKMINVRIVIPVKLNILNGNLPNNRFPTRCQFCPMGDLFKSSHLISMNTLFFKSGWK